MLYGSLCSCNSFGRWTCDFICTFIARKTWPEKWKHYTEAVDVNWTLDKRKFWFTRICIKFATSRATHHWDTFISHLHLLPDRNRKTEKDGGQKYSTEKGIVRGYLIFKQSVWKFMTWQNMVAHLKWSSTFSFCLVDSKTCNSNGHKHYSSNYMHRKLN